MSSAAAAGEAAYGGGVLKRALQQPGPGALLYAPNSVAVYRKPAIPPFYQQPAASNAAAPTAPTRSPASANPLKRKRGRPRKYGPADGASPLAVVSPSQTAPAPADVGTDSGASPKLPPGFSPSPQGGGVVGPQASPAAAAPLPASNASPAMKRGRPLGSTNKKPQPQAAAPGNVLPAFSAGASSGSKSGKEALLGLIIFQFRLQIHVYTSRHWYFSMGKRSIRAYYLFIHSFFFMSPWHSGSSGNQGQWSCGHGMVYFGDNDLPLPWHLLEISFRKEMPRIELK